MLSPYPEARVQIINNTYDTLVKWYTDFLSTEEAKIMIYDFNTKIGKVDITDTKKVDFILWQTRP
jgi:hypothetical protein